ncbi:MAG: class I SAM-dependent methyltransferase [Methanomassiliicoccales archaeon]
MSETERSFSEGSDTSYRETLDLYESTAKYYDIWYDDFDQDVRFYLQLAGQVEGPILECMCGTGRLLIPLAERGYRVLGVDRSPAMLDVCTRKIELQPDQVQERIEILQEDVRDFSTDQSFDMAIIPFNSFLHLLDTVHQERALRNIHDHMVPGGMLTLSLFNPDLRRHEDVVRHSGTKVTDQGEIISKFESQSFDFPSQTTRVHYFYDISRQDRELRRVTAAFTLRYIFHREAVELLERCGFRVKEVYGDYAFTPFTDKCEMMIFQAERA